jgi:cathepsin L
MKSGVVASIVVAAAADQFDDFKQQFGKVYNGEEEAAARATFNANVAKNEAHNAQGLSWTLGINQFSDLTQEQYKVQAGLGYKPANTWGAMPKLGEHTYNGEELALEVDWTTKGAVTPVKDQGQCGSCWAFSTTGGMEGAWEIGSGKLTSMSEQQLVDCSKNGNMGCNGGSMELAFAYEEGVNVCTEQSYPYRGVGGTCKASSCSTAVPKGGITGYKTVQESTEALKSAIMQNPVSVAIEADQYAFQGYNSGTISSGCGTNLDHGVLAVGYGDEYYLVKNSWGTSWGMQGYVQISTAGNVCGIHSDASYPTVDGSAPPAPPGPAMDLEDAPAVQLHSATAGACGDAGVQMVGRTTAQALVTGGGCECKGFCIELCKEGFCDAWEVNHQTNECRCHRLFEITKKSGQAAWTSGTIPSAEDEVDLEDALVV